MRVLIVDERPNQLFAPFFRFAAADAWHSLRVIYTQPHSAVPVFDAEIGRQVRWGMDLLAGYESLVAPAGASREWWVREFTREAFDLIVLNGYTRAPYIAAARAARQTGVPAALRLDSVLFSDSVGRRFLKRIVFAVFFERLFRGYFAAGSLTRKYLNAYGVPDSKIWTFPYAIDEQAFREQSRLTPAARMAKRDSLGVEAGAKVVLCVAKLHRRESPWDVLRALPLMRTPRPVVLIAGDGPDRAALEQHAARHGLREVRFLGYVPYAGLAPLYAASDVFVHAAQEERWGVSVAEAMACGLPVIASSRVGAGYDMIESGTNGFQYQAGDPADLAARLSEALALNREKVDTLNQEVLAKWNYHSVWGEIIKCANAMAA